VKYKELEKNTKRTQEDFRTRIDRQLSELAEGVFAADREVPKKKGNAA
jgi:hypothetical protein